MPARRSTIPWTLALIGLAALAAWVAVGLGSAEGQLTFRGDWLGALLGGDRGGEIDQRLVIHWRLPRAAAALLVGGALALAGLVLQAVTRNPLADPYLLGISGGAGLAVVLVRCVLASDAGAWWLTPLAAFGGAAAASVFVLTLARGSGGRVTVLGLILAGVVVNALCAALMAFILARLDPFRLRITTLWLIGGIGYASWLQLALVACGVLVAAVWLRADAHRLNTFALGADAAQSVGVDAQRLLRRAAGLSSLLTALGVSLGGLLGYVGLIVPHAVRLLVGQDLRRSLPAAMGAGSLLLIVADTAARTAFAPEELPVGVLTALVGCPVLLVLLKAQLRGGDRR